VRVDDIRFEDDRTRFEISGRVTMDRLDTDGLRIWFRGPIEYANGELDASPFLPSLLATAMWWGEPLRIEAPVSAQLLDSVPLATRRYQSLFPSLRAITVSAPRQTLPCTPATTACFFTRGIDSWYSVLTNVEDVDPSRPPLTHLLHISGIDWALTAPTREREIAATRAAAADAGCELVLLETNLRDFTERFQPWDVTHGGALAAMGLTVGTRFSHVLIASTFPLYRLQPWGSHPMLDPLWSTERTEIVHDAAEVSRADKFAFVADRPRALANLKVCFEADSEYNCGNCEKCLLTMAGLQAAGVRTDLAGFAVPLDARRLARHTVSTANRQLVPELAERLTGPGDRPYRLALECMLLRGDLRSALRRLIRIAWLAVRPRGSRSGRRSG
jgi:hypothetical protein